MNTVNKLKIQELLNKGRECHMVGNFEEAQAIYLRVLQMEPRNAEVNFLYGSLAYQTGEVQIALKRLSTAVRLDPSRADYHNNMGLALQTLGDNKKASHSFRRAIKLQSDFPDAINNLGTALKNDGHQEQAEKMFRDALKVQPDFVEALSNLGGILAENGAFTEAIECTETALKIDSTNALLYFNLGVSCQSDGQDERALDAYLKAISINSRLVEAQQNAGVLLKEFGRFDEAIDVFHKVLEINPESIEALYSLSGSQKYEAYTNEVETMERLFTNADTSVFNKTQLGFGLGKIHEDLKNYDTAFDYFEKANHFKRQSYTYSVDSDIQSFEKIKSVFVARFFEERDSFGCSDKTPIFVIGMPRSGTSLTEQILSSHPKVHGAGELLDLPNVCFSDGKLVAPTFPDRALNLNSTQVTEMANIYLSNLRTHSDGASHITDKLPENFFYVGMIKLLMPNAKIVHCQRNPLDTCLSNYKNNFEVSTDYAYNQIELGKYFCAYQDLMNHWHQTLPGFVFDLRYEDLISNPEQAIKDMLSYCGLDYNAQCLDFHQSKRSVKTASVFQVRQPIYKSSLNSWKKYKKHLAPLQKILAGHP